MTPVVNSYLKIALGIVVLAAILSYVWVKSSDFIEGPVIIIHTPLSGETSDSLILITGEARHINNITLNDRKIFVDEEGLFSEQLLLSVGYNIITIEVGDRFKRTVRETIELVLMENNE
ncbi:hypothetical protein IID27_02945 [Patescibacteria group bacterium]|nr:hypothetical protein [Patescibacteria group bacterium]